MRTVTSQCGALTHIFTCTHLHNAAFLESVRLTSQPPLITVPQWRTSVSAFTPANLIYCVAPAARYTRWCALCPAQQKRNMWFETCAMSSEYLGIYGRQNNDYVVILSNRFSRIRVQSSLICQIKYKFRIATHLMFNQISNINFYKDSIRITIIV